MADSPYIVEVSAENFAQVIQASYQLPVLIDFWADWCQPCKMLMPILAKLADDYGGKFLLAKLNTEQLQEIAAEFGIRSIPTVKLFQDGQPVDEFMGALPEEEIRAFIDKHIPRESDAAVDQAIMLLNQGDSDTALQILQQVQQTDPDNPRLLRTLAQAQVLGGDVAGATATLDALPLDQQNDPEVAALRSHLFFGEILHGACAAAVLEQRLSENETDSEARYQLAARKVVDQEYESAMELFLELMRRDRGFGDDAARKALVKLFDLLGNDPLVARYRGRMASLLY
jgi:putative thioredoxin